MDCTETDLRALLAQHGGTIAAGSHLPEYLTNPAACPLCILELQALCDLQAGRRETLSDDPDLAGRPDYRAINDGPWSSRAAATEPLLRLHLAYAAWRDMPSTEQDAVIKRVVIWTVREIIAALPGLPAAVVQQCRTVSTLTGAEAAAWAAAAAEEAARAPAAAAAAWAAAAAAEAAWAAAWAARAAAADGVLTTAVDLWIRAIQC